MVLVLPFNVSDLTLFNVGDDSRSNPFEERGDDEDKPNTKRNHANDPLQVPIGPITRAKAKKLKEALWCKPRDHVVTQPARKDTNSRKAK